MEKAQVKQVIENLLKEVDKKNNMVNRSLVNGWDAYNDLKGMIDGIKLTLGVFFPNEIFIEIGIINGIVNDLFVGTKEQKEVGENSLKLALFMLEK